METEEAVPERQRAERRGETRLDAEWPVKGHLIRAAQLASEGGMHDCALLETSRNGARVYLMARLDVPGICTLRSDGNEWTLRRAWQRDRHVGFKVVGGSVPAPVSAHEPETK